MLAGVSILVVFSILVILVLILNLFTLAAKKTEAKVSAVKETHDEKKQAKTFNKASEEDKAAVAVALHLYFTEKENRESRILTIVPTPNSAWGATLNPRL